MTAHQAQMEGFAKYNAEFNHRLFGLVAGLTDTERKKDMAAFFGSIHATLNHILLADRIWLGRSRTLPIAGSGLPWEQQWASSVSGPT